MPDQVPAAADAMAALDLVEAFESGVRRAQDAATALVTPSPWGAEPPSDRWVDDSVAPVSAPRALPGAEGRSLNRRVPGATLSPLESSPRRPVGRPAIEQDPDEARRLVEQFESGVARAIHDASPRNRP
jgi:hypothetical protein